jgi:hypothetical protein
VFAAGGIVPAVFGYYWGLVTLVVLPPSIWMSRHLASQRLVLTTKGVLYERGKGSRALDVFVPWPTIEKVELVVSRGRKSDGSPTYDHYLVFEHAEPKPLRYLLASRPSKELLKSVGRICREQGVKFKC